MSPYETVDSTHTSCAAIAYLMDEEQELCEDVDALADIDRHVIE